MAAQAPEAALGTAAPDFVLRGTDGQWHALGDLAGPRGTVLAFICNHCPYVQAILPRLLRDARALLPLGVHLVAINANDADSYPDDDFAHMVSAARDWPFPYLHDDTQAVARAYGAVCTPDFFGYDTDLRLRYRGQLDASRKDTAPEGARRDLFEAMRMVAETGHAPTEQHPSIGCSIKWKAA